MSHDLAMATFVFGAVLVLVGLVSGGFSLFGAQVSGRAGGLARLIALVGGVALIVLSLSVLAPGLIPGLPTVSPGVTQGPAPAQALDNSGRYRLDSDNPRSCEVTRIGDINYKVGEFSGPWPWEGTVTLNGNMLDGMAHFKSGTQMRVTGTVLPDRSIDIHYIYISDDQGKPMNRQDNHHWMPVN